MTEISKCEKEVLNIIYAETDDLALQDVLTRVNEVFGHIWKPQTVSTFLARLVKKGWLSMYRKGRYCYYQPLISKEEYDKYVWNEVLTSSFSGNIEKFKDSVSKFYEEQVK